MIDVPAIHCPVRDKVQLRKLLDDSFCNEDEFISLDLGRMYIAIYCTTLAAVGAANPISDDRFDGYLHIHGRWLRKP